MDLDSVVGTYVALRDRKAAMKAEYEELASKVDAAMAKIEARLLEYFTEVGVESIRTEHGTAYKSVFTSATVADRDAFLTHVLQANALELLETRCAKKAVEEYVGVYNAPPPGVNITRIARVNFRRS